MDSFKLKSKLSYNETTGVFTWIKNNKPAGYSLRGYVYIQVDGKAYPAHRLAWLYVYGELPVGMLDHINQCRADNRVSNLRIATNQENQYNVNKFTNNTGVKGVCKHNSKFKARLTYNRRTIHLGVFNTIEEAQQAYLAAKHKVCHQIISMTSIKIVEHT
jgi:phosphotransferase system IIB component